METLIFAARNGLDSQQMRSTVIRIPEVSIRIRAAQFCLEKMGIGNVDLCSLFYVDTEKFIAKPILREFVGVVVQLGLLDRYLRHHAMPDIVIGDKTALMCAKIAMNRMKFFELVERFLTKLSRPHLSLLSVEKDSLDFEVYERQAKKIFKPIEGLEVGKDLNVIIESLALNRSVRRFIFVGPGYGELSHLAEKKWVWQNVEFLETMDLDPMMSYFCGQVEAG